MTEGTTACWSPDLKRSFEKYARECEPGVIDYQGLEWMVGWISRNDRPNPTKQVRQLPDDTKASECGGPATLRVSF
jgi:hypothetical protein